MRSKITLGIALVLLASASPAFAQSITLGTPTEITLGRPQPLPAPETPAPETPAFRPIASSVRGQIPDPPPPPAFPGGGPPPVAFIPNNADMYNKGVVNSDADL